MRATPGLFALDTTTGAAIVRGAVLTDPIDGVVPTTLLDLAALAGAFGMDAEPTVMLTGGSADGVIGGVRPSFGGLLNAFATEYAPEPSTTAPSTSGATRRTKRARASERCMLATMRSSNGSFGAYASARL